MSNTRRPNGAVAMTFVGAAMCTAYSADMAWRFAGSRLGMTDSWERGAMFAVAEFAMLCLANLARHTNHMTGSPGPAGTIVWLVTLVQTVPAFLLTDSLLTASVRAFFGPVLAAILWHLALGLELRHATGEASRGILASACREVSERVLSRLGLAQRGRDAAQLTRDRATVRAAELAAKLAEMPDDARGRTRVSRKLADAVARAEVAVRDDQRDTLMAMLTARRTATTLATVELTNPWVTGHAAPEADMDVATADDYVAIVDDTVTALANEVDIPVAVVTGQEDMTTTADQGTDTPADTDDAWDNALADMVATDADTPAVIVEEDTDMAMADAVEVTVRPSRGRTLEEIQAAVDYLRATGQEVTGKTYAEHVGTVSARTGRRDLARVGVTG